MSIFFYVVNFLMFSIITFFYLFQCFSNCFDYKTFITLYQYFVQCTIYIVQCTVNSVSIHQNVYKSKGLQISPIIIQFRYLFDFHHSLEDLFANIDLVIILYLKKKYFRVTFCSDLICNKIIMVRHSCVWGSNF